MGVVDRSGWHRPVITGKEVMVSSGHSLATLAGIDIIKKGGNAIDAGVAMGMCINVLQPDFTNFGGVAPIILYSALEDKVFNISGLGTWPKAATIDVINERGGKLTQDHWLDSVVPSAADAWMTTLALFGTMSFSEVAASAIKLAGEGFPIHPFMINNLVRRPRYRRYKYTESILFPGGKLPRMGDLLIQRDLARTLKRLVRVEERNRHLGRHGALMAARDEFYMGDIAKELVAHVQEEGGLLTLEDMAGFHVGLEDPVKTGYRDLEVYCCGPWCQGPVNNITLNILEGYDLSSMEHNSAEYIHLVASALDLAFSDREEYIGDPRFVDVPLEGLTSKEYAKIRRGLIDPDTAWGKMPPAGDPRNMKATLPGWKEPDPGGEGGGVDTSYGCVIDSEGNAFSTTPSDGGRLVPGLGVTVSSRGRMSWLTPGHASAVAPGKRPRLTPNPALAFKDGELYMAYGCPGGDAQPQAMVQLVLNVVDFDMNVQEAIEAPRFQTENFPDSHWPHTYLAGRLNLEARIPREVVEGLKHMGHNINLYPDCYARATGSLCAILVDKGRNLLMGGADPRAVSYAIAY